MPIPDKPYTRREAYLNAAATGDSSGIPETPYTREEMYLDAIAKGGGGGGSSTLSGLTDVDISNPTDGQTLVYNASAGKWENGAGGGVLVVTLDADNHYQADKTCAEIMAAIEGGGVLFRSNYSVLLLQGYAAQGTNYFFAVGEYDAATSGYSQIELYGVGPDSFPESGGE